MTDYFYHSGARRRAVEDADRRAVDAPRSSPYPPEDEAYWAESGHPAPVTDDDDAPLWYEDRVRPEDAFPDEPGDDAAFAAEAPLPAADDWTEDGATDDAPDGSEGGLPAPAPGRAYVPGATAAAARAAAAAGTRSIRFDPTKERGTPYYDKAARHSRHVRLMKIGLPLLAVLSVAGFFAVMAIGRGGDGLPALNLSGIDLDTREITMDKPHISGFDGTKRAYEVNAAKAVQALGNPKVVNLETINAKFAVAENVRANLVARNGIYDANTQKLKLDGGIDITTTDGYAGKLEQADVDIEKGTVFSDTGVMLTGKEGRITADSIEVLDRGKHIFFRGNVKVHFIPPEDAGEAAAPAAEAPATTTAPAAASEQATPDGST